MQLGKNDVANHNERLLKDHARRLEFVSKDIARPDDVIRKLVDLHTV